MAIVSSCARGENLVVAGHEPQLDPGQRPGAGQRAGQHMDAIRGRETGHADVGNDEPLGRFHGPIVWIVRTRLIIALRRILLRLARRHRLVARARHHHIDAGLHLRHGFHHGEGGDDFLVEFGLHIDGAGPDLHASFIDEGLGLVAADLRQKIGGAHHARQIAVADADDVHGHARRVDGDERHALLPHARQNIILAGEAHLRGAIPHIDFEVRIPEQIFAHRRRQALAQHDGVALAVLQPLHAELLIFRGDRRRAAAGDRDKWGEIHRAARQRLGERKAGARRRRIAVDRLPQHAKPIFLAQGFIDGAHRRRIVALETRPIGVEGGPPILTLHVDIPEQGQRRGLLSRRGGAQIAAKGGGGRGLELGVTVGLIPIQADGEGGARIGHPERGIIGRGNQSGAQRTQGVARTAAPDQLRALARQIANGARRGSGVVLFQLLFEADDVAGEGIVPEGLGTILRHGAKGEKS